MQLITEAGFEVGFCQVIGLGHLEKLKDEGVPQEVVWLADDVALGGKLEDVCFISAGCQAEEEGGFDLALELPHRPFLPGTLLLIKTALQRVIQL